MSWMEKLYQTYEAGVFLDLPPEESLMPISHTLQNAHINIVLDGEGNFRRASVLEKTQIALPATESSASRSSGEAAHPLADKLQYVAQDYAAFGGRKKPYFEGYKNQMRAWCQSEFAHSKVQAVYRYIEKGKVIADLVEHGILFAGLDNKLLTRWDESQGDIPLLFKVLPKEKGELDQGSALVCWSVELGVGDKSADTWKDPEIYQSWIGFDAQQAQENGLCFVTGLKQNLSTNHPAKLRHTGDKAKLISSNDTSGYTYRGRFLDETQACSIGFDVSQKAHNALRWLISRQGNRSGDLVYVAWAVSGKPIPEPLTDSFSLFENLDDDDFELEVDEGNTVISTESIKDYTIDLGQSYANKLKKYMAGYAVKLDYTDQIIIMGLDSATPGRMGILYYREKFSGEFLARLEAWHKEFAWPQRHIREIANENGKKPKTKVIWPISSPVPKDIAIAAYGSNVTQNLKNKVIERLVPSIIDGQPLPRDLMENCIRKATNRNGYANDEQWLWEKTIGIACALYKGYYQRHPNLNQRRNYAMALEENYVSRDYLYGRLLAIAERIEDMALNIGGENRTTTAGRLMQRFADRPYETWRTIELALQPYIQRLKVSSYGGFLNNRLKELDSVLALFNAADFNKKEPLSGEFLLAYHAQRQKYRTKTETTDENTVQGDHE